MALTTTVAGRTINYSHTVGRNAASGNGFTNPIGLALGPDRVAYVVNRANENNNTPTPLRSASLSRAAKRFWPSSAGGETGTARPLGPQAWPSTARGMFMSPTSG